MLRYRLDRLRLADALRIAWNALGELEREVHWWPLSLERNDKLEAIERDREQLLAAIRALKLSRAKNVEIVAVRPDLQKRREKSIGRN